MNSNNNNRKYDNNLPWQHYIITRSGDAELLCITILFHFFIIYSIRPLGYLHQDWSFSSQPCSTLFYSNNKETSIMFFFVRIKYSFSVSLTLNDWYMSPFSIFMQVNNKTESWIVNFKNFQDNNRHSFQDKEIHKLIQYSEYHTVAVNRRGHRMFRDGAVYGSKGLVIIGN